MKEVSKEVLERILDEILAIPQVHESMGFCSDKSKTIIDIIEHALERQYIMGGIDAINEDL